MPAVIAICIGAVALGSLILLRLAGGSMPWGHLLIAVGPDGRPMRPRVKWRLWSMSHGESPWLALVAGFASVALGCLALAVTTPWLLRSVFQPMRPAIMVLLTFGAALALVLVPTGLSVFVRALLDLTARRASMSGMVVGMRRDVGVFGRTYHIAVRAGDRSMAQVLWAESFKVDKSTFGQLAPGDRISLEYSPHLRHVYRTVLPQPADHGLAAAH